MNKVKILKVLLEDEPTLRNFTERYWKNVGQKDKTIPVLPVINKTPVAGIESIVLKFCGWSIILHSNGSYFIRDET